LAVIPVIYVSIMVILHPRVGGPATAAVLANAIPGLAGFGAALLTLHLIAVHQLGDICAAMKMITEYLEKSLDFDRMATEVKDPELKAALMKQAAAYRKLAEERARELNWPPPR